ncbi:MAG: LysR family transcriptional regulator [Duodenibacillus sp.]|nr:LysR family transcriptional regulator [Duodenibacillus sp.]
MPKTDDLGAWRAFVTCARAGSLTAAAKAMETEVSTVSRAIVGLEKALGCELIRHNTRPVELTEAGGTALKRMETILRAHDALVENLQNDKRTLSGRVRLSTAQGFATRRLMPVIRRFCDENPGMSIDILTGVREAELAKGLCDVAVLTGEPHLPGLVYMSRGRNVYLPVASPDYVRRHGLPLTPENLRNHKGYAYCGPVRGETKELTRGSRVEPVQFATVVRSTDILAVREAVLAGMGVAVDMPLVQIFEDLQEGRLVPILPGWALPPIECFVVANRDAWHLKRVRLFFEWYARTMQALFRGYEAAVSTLVGLPPDARSVDRTRIFMT